RRAPRGRRGHPARRRVTRQLRGPARGAARSSRGRSRGRRLRARRRAALRHRHAGRAAVMAERDPLTATTLTEVMRRRASVTPETPYFHLYGETVRYGPMWQQSARYAAGLARAGVKAGDKVCPIYPTCDELFYT